MIRFQSNRTTIKIQSNTLLFHQYELGYEQDDETFVAVRKPHSMPCLRLPVPVAGTGAGVFSSSSSTIYLPNLFYFVDTRRQLRLPAIAAKARPNKRDKPLQKPLEVAGSEEETIEVDETEGRGEEDFDYFPSSNEFKGEQEEGEMEVDGFLNSSSGYGGRGNEEDYDKDPELAEILGSCFDDPEKGQSRVTHFNISSIQGLGLIVWAEKGGGGFLIVLICLFFLYINRLRKE